MSFCGMVPISTLWTLLDLAGLAEISHYCLYKEPKQNHWHFTKNSLTIVRGGKNVTAFRKKSLMAKMSLVN